MNVGFPRHTLITTDQGIFPVQTLDPQRHTINGEAILEVVQAPSPTKQVVCFVKDAFKQGYPSAPTFLAPDHHLFFQGRMVPAMSFVGVRGGVGMLEGYDKPLYNVVLPQHRMMLVHQLTCETAL